MAFKLQQIDLESKFTHHFKVEILEACYPRELVQEVLTSCHAWEKRERKLSQMMIVYYIMSLWLFRSLNLRAVFSRLVSALRWNWPCAVSLPTDAALIYRRRQLGTTVLRHLFRRCCRVLSTPQTPGCFRFGLRLMALDSTLQDVADKPANAVHFGRMTSGKSASPFPQMRCLYLAEVGTHVVIDAVPAPCGKSEQRLAPALLRSMHEGMLVLMDRNFPSTEWISSVRQTGAHVLVRLPANRFERADRVLPDGSFLHTLTPSNGPAFQVRIIEYRLDPLLTDELSQQPCSRTSDPSDPGQVHRLLTTLLDPELAPAEELILCYHERWEIEELIGEIKTRPHFSEEPLRSQDPFLVYQELYGLLLGHYAVRAWMFRSAQEADLDPDRLSFTHAIEVLHQACAQTPPSTQEEQVHFHQRILSDLREHPCLLPPRRLRFYPRVVKRAQSHFHRKQAHHQGFDLKQTSFRELLLI